MRIAHKTLYGKKKLLPLPTQCPGGGMVDALVSGASAARRASSSLVPGTFSEFKSYTQDLTRFFFCDFFAQLLKN